MDKEKIKEKVERFRLLADIFIKNNTKAYIKTISGNLHFCVIVLNGEDSLTVDNFGPEQRASTRDRIYWVEVEYFEEYENRSARK